MGALNMPLEDPSQTTASTPIAEQPGDAGNGEIWARYRRQIQLVIDHIHHDPTAALDNNTLADIACLSPYHWHRIYRAIAGETAAVTVRRARLHRAATALLRSNDSIADIGAANGYPDVHSFTRAFTAHYGMPPGKFRKNYQSPVPAHRESTLTANEFPVEIRQQPSRTLFGQWHQGDYLSIGHAFETIMMNAQTGGWMPLPPESVGVYLHDPAAVTEAELRSFAGLSMPADPSGATPPEPMQSYVIPATRTATLIHIGPYAQLAQAYEWLYSYWLPASGEAVADTPCFEIYLDDPRNTPPDRLTTLINLPLLS